MVPIDVPIHNYVLGPPKLQPSKSRRTISPNRRNIPQDMLPGQFLGFCTGLGFGFRGLGFRVQGFRVCLGFRGLGGGLQCYVWFTGFGFRASVPNKTRASFRSQYDHMYTLDLHVIQIAPRKVHAYSKPKPTA